MSNKATGTVAMVGSKNGYSYLKLDDGVFYGFGKSNPKCNEGDAVTFEYTTNQKGDTVYNNGDAKTLEVLEDAPERPAAPASNQYSSGSGSKWTTNDYWRTKFEHEVNKTQPEIRHQASRSDAIAVLRIAQDAGVLDLPKTKGKGLDALFAMVTELTEQFAGETDEYSNQPNTTNEDRGEE